MGLILKFSRAGCSNFYIRASYGWEPIAHFWIDDHYEMFDENLQSNAKMNTG